MSKSFKEFIRLATTLGITSILLSGGACSKIGSELLQGLSKHLFKNSDTVIRRTAPNAVNVWSNPALRLPARRIGTEFVIPTNNEENRIR